ncbi:MAG: DNA-binding transcriptional regulator NtrC [Burkholderia gladioli]|nr:MAG: DNA-binding transcriptional regulator NtrC [Burkholderia gladioli]
MRYYCFDYVTMPCDRERIVESVGHAYGMITLSEPPLATARGEGEMVGACEAMLGLFRTLRKVASTDAPVFISGESGTGKELSAVAIHERSSRAGALFVAINCAAIPHHLLQSELFGYERGEFTGATQRKIGRVEAAHGGTLFLDEIGDLPLESQASLLRFLQEGRIERLSGHASIPVDVRVICATHVDMETALRADRFREDLYHRLCVLKVTEPPLRARQGHRSAGAPYARPVSRRREPPPARLRARRDRRHAQLHVARQRARADQPRAARDRDVGRAHDQRGRSGTDGLRRIGADLAERRARGGRAARDRDRAAAASRPVRRGRTRTGVSRVTLYRLMVAHGMRDRDVETIELAMPAAG